jgi:hypothetical protein
LATFNGMVVDETINFFQSVLDSEIKQKEPSNPQG